MLNRPTQTNNYSKKEEWEDNAKRMAKKSDLAWNYRVALYYYEKSTMTPEREKTYLNRDT